MSNDYNHAEAFALMKYVSDDGTERELIWNSRDGVTPFTTTCIHGDKTMTHVGWRNDVCNPDYVPLVGSRVWVDMTPEIATEHATRYVDRFWNGKPPMSGSFDTREEAINFFIKQWTSQPGNPASIVVTEEWLTQYKADKSISRQ